MRIIVYSCALIATLIPVLAGSPTANGEQQRVVFFFFLIIECLFWSTNFT